MLLQVVGELWSFEELEGTARNGAESPKTRSCLPMEERFHDMHIKWKPSATEISAENRFWHTTLETPAVEQDCPEVCPAQLIGQTPLNMYIE